MNRGVWVLEQILGRSATAGRHPWLEEQDHQDVQGLTLRQLRSGTNRKPPVVTATKSSIRSALAWRILTPSAAGATRPTKVSLLTRQANCLMEQVFPPAELKNLLAKADLARNFTERLMAFAIGRQLRGYDDVVSDPLMIKIAKDDNRIRAINTEVIASNLFTHRRIKG